MHPCPEEEEEEEGGQEVEGTTGDWTWVSNFG